MERECAINRLLFVVAVDGCDVVNERLLKEITHTLETSLGQGPRRDRPIGIDDHVGMGYEVDALH